MTAIHSAAESPVDAALLRALARKYLWWNSPEEAAAHPDRLIAQVMNIGDYDDVQAVAAQAGDEVLRRVLREAAPGVFDARSWTYWHYRLGLADVGEVPPLPVRTFASTS